MSCFRLGHCHTWWARHSSIRDQTKGSFHTCSRMVAIGTTMSHERCLMLFFCRLDSESLEILQMARFEGIVELERSCGTSSDEDGSAQMCHRWAATQSSQPPCKTFVASRHSTWCMPSYSPMIQACVSERCQTPDCRVLHMCGLPMANCT